MPENRWCRKIVTIAVKDDDRKRRSKNLRERKCQWWWLGNGGGNVCETAVVRVVCVQWKGVKRRLRNIVQWKYWNILNLGNKGLEAITSVEMNTRCKGWFSGEAITSVDPNNRCKVFEPITSVDTNTRCKLLFLTFLHRFKLPPM